MRLPCCGFPLQVSPVCFPKTRNLRTRIGHSYCCPLILWFWSEEAGTTAPTSALASRQVARSHLRQHHDPPSAGAGFSKFTDFLLRGASFGAPKLDAVLV